MTRKVFYTRYVFATPWRWFSESGMGPIAARIFPGCIPDFSGMRIRDESAGIRDALKSGMHPGIPDFSGMRKGMLHHYTF